LSLFLGIDVGTGGTRALVIDERGGIVASATAEHAPFASPQTGWAEQDPHDWWRATRESVAAVLRQPGVSADAIKAIGFSGQMHGSTLLDSHDEVVRPALLWCDQRTDRQCRQITEAIGAARLIELTLNPALTGFTAPKLLWVREHEPELWRSVRSVLLPKDYVRFRLTGYKATDVADASGTLLFDVGMRKWSTTVLDALDLKHSLMPEAFESPMVTGSVSEAGAEATGLKAGTPVVGGGGDQAAGAVGMGIVRAGAVSATIGTSGVVFAATDRPVLEPGGRIHTFCHAVPGRWHVMGVTLGAGLSLRWFRDQFVSRGAEAPPPQKSAEAPPPRESAEAPPPPRRAEALPPHESTEAERTHHAVVAAGLQPRDPYDVMTDAAATAPAGSDGVLWAPYLMGERTPHLDPHARAALVGLSGSHSKAHVFRAVLEGVAFSLKDSFSIFEAMQVPVSHVRLGGGGARSPLWRKIQADTYGYPVEIVAAEEGAAYGAALLAGVGAGTWKTVDDACDAVVRVVTRIEPDPTDRATLARQYERYRKLYPALKSV
jgi:xylulokinase